VSPDVFARIRRACAAVMERARHVRVDHESARALVRDLAAPPLPAPQLDPAHHHVGDAASTLAYVLTLDAINFGSGWFPHLRKRPGLSGYLTVATALKERFERDGPWSAAQLAALGSADCAEVLGQDPTLPPAAELMDLYAQALGELGRFLQEGYGGRFEGPIEAAAGSAARLVEILTAMPLYRDVARFEGCEVPFYKRAQITASDLAAAFAGRSPGRFHDLDRLTCFADNLVPHVLRLAGVLVYTPELARRIDAEELLPAGSTEEVEIRAGAVHAVECCVEAARTRGIEVTARQLDSILWKRGHAAGLKAQPRHRTRTPYY
jgi:hypothetical protein